MATAYKNPSSVEVPRRLGKPGSASSGMGDGLDPGQDIVRQRWQALNRTVRELKNTNREIEALRLLTESDGIASTALWSMVQISSSGYKVKGFDTSNNLFSMDVTQIAGGILQAINTLSDYTEGFNHKPTVGTLVERMLNEVVCTAGLCTELVLNDALLPDYIELVPYEQIQYRARGAGRGYYPVQTPPSGEDEVELDIPTFFVAESKKGANDEFASSMFGPAANTAFHFMEFVEDMRRVVRESGHARTVAKLNRERVMQLAQDLGYEEAKDIEAFMERVQGQVGNFLSGLNPQDAIVSYDDVEYDTLAAEGVKADYSQALGTLAGMYSTSLKTHPSVMGLRLNGSQSLSNTESLVYLKLCRGVQTPVEQVMSRILTLGVRLYGIEGHVEFRFDPIDLRPEHELEAFYTMREERIYRRLSLGLISDEEAAFELGITNLPEGYTPKSGTMFHQGADVANLAKNVRPNDDPQGREMQPDTPNNGGGESQ